MSLALVDRDPTSDEFEAFRLVLSVYQDGSGGQQHHSTDELTLPGWRDFERAVAFVFGGKAPRGKEGKNVFDIWIPDPDRPSVNFGLSCKMRREWDKLQKTHRVTMELSNSAKKFWQRLSHQGITTANYTSHPSEVGDALITMVKEWHQAESVTNPGGTVDLGKSSYLVLSWSRAGTYQLHRFRLELPDPSTLRWYFPINPKTGKVAAHLNGDTPLGGRLFEWYGESGGQLKYYPLERDAVWMSSPFRLEPLPPSQVQYGLYLRATTYFPQVKAILPAPGR